MGIQRFAGHHEHELIVLRISPASICEYLPMHASVPSVKNSLNTPRFQLAIRVAFALGCFHQVV
jgi:hypothetical protein